MIGSSSVARWHRTRPGTGSVRMPNRILVAVVLLILGGCVGLGAAARAASEPGVAGVAGAARGAGTTAAPPASARAQAVDVVSHALTGKLNRMLAARPVRNGP